MNWFTGLTAILVVLLFIELRAINRATNRFKEATADADAAIAEFHAIEDRALRYFRTPVVGDDQFSFQPEEVREACERIFLVAKDGKVINPNASNRV